MSLQRGILIVCEMWQSFYLQIWKGFWNSWDSQKLILEVKPSSWKRNLFVSGFLGGPGGQVRRFAGCREVCTVPRGCVKAAWPAGGILGIPLLDVDVHNNTPQWVHKMLGVSGHWILTKDFWVCLMGQEWLRKIVFRCYETLKREGWLWRKERCLKLSGAQNMTSTPVMWCKRFSGGLDDIIYVKHQEDAVININEQRGNSKKHGSASSKSEADSWHGDSQGADSTQPWLLCWHHSFWELTPQHVKPGLVSGTTLPI